MKTEIVVFKNGTYEKPCSFFNEIKIGSINCVGHSKISSIKKCKFCVSYKEDKNYYLPILKEETKIVSEVTCNRPGI